MGERRSYQQFCGLARALDRVGERWTLLIVRNLLLGPRRYSDLLHELPGITTNLLAKRLKEMESLGILEKRALAPPAAGEAYALTALGEGLEPAVMELARWGGAFMGAPHPHDRVDIGWGLLSMKRRYRGGLSLVVGLEIGERAFELVFEPDYLAVKEREPIRADVVLRCPQEVLRELFWGGADGIALRDTGRLLVTGRQQAFRSLLRAFTPPAKNLVPPAPKHL
jgi:DNA-binding HxlR family transcriptional regulator